jgi:hypothetical protein
MRLVDLLQRSEVGLNVFVGFVVNWQCLVLVVVLVFAEQADSSRRSFNSLFLWDQNVVKACTVVTVKVLATLMARDTCSVFSTSEASVLSVFLEVF